ncbi:hypothetical protein OHB00_41570 [Streptomyces sp. NBC_00631]|uniref:hypothetical protein n=1 Tax=Streptomyces sp. NBC_00631 TaxID=2975793 RepID=UPI0030E0EE13
MTIDPKPAKVDCTAKLRVTSDGPVKVTLTGCGAVRCGAVRCGAAREFEAGTTVLDLVDLPLL